MQRNWIGRSEGARVKFPIQGTGDSIEVFTTRIDTIFGATFVMLAPEHPPGQRLRRRNPKIRAGVPGSKAQKFRAQDRAGRMTRRGQKEGFFTGRFAINPFTNQPVPIWVANYVLGEYGTGAVMGVPGARRARFRLREEIRPADHSGDSSGRRRSRRRTAR